MSPAELFAQPWCRPVALALLHFVWQGALVAAVLAVAVELLGVRRPQARYACSLAALVAMIALPALTVAWFWSAEAPSPAALQYAAIAPELPLTAAAAGDLIARAQPYLLGMWLAGVGFFAARLMAGLAGVRRLQRNLLPLAPDLAARVRKLGGRLRIDGVRVVHLSRHVGEAIAVGLFRPLVLIPAAWANEMPTEMLEAVIAHELAHLRRGDLWVNFAQRVVETLLFYHPAVWWLSRRLRVERELCCDELAVAATGRRLEYAQALETVARRRVARVQPLLAAGIRGEKNMRLLQRVRNVLGLQGTADRSRLWPAGIVALALPLAAWGIAAGWATADEERREGDKPAAVRREGDRPAAKETPREGDSELRIKQAPRDGEVRKEGARDGEIRKEGPRDGEVRKEGPRDGERPVKPGVRDGERPSGGDGRIAEMEALINKLKQQIEYLERELAAARGGREPIKREGEGVRRPDAPREGGDVKRPEFRREGEGVKKPEVRREGEIRKEEPRREGEGVKKPEPRREGDK
jgi:beta-lactamase regulating signal transducer with metallopeptidase domain